MTQYTVVLMAIFTAEGYKANQQRKKVRGLKSRGDQEQASKSPFPVESHRWCLVSPRSCANTCEISSPREAH